jgi:hypothetical protein
LVWLDVNGGLFWGGEKYNCNNFNSLSIINVAIKICRRVRGMRDFGGKSKCGRREDNIKRIGNEEVLNV